MKGWFRDRPPSCVGIIRTGQLFCTSEHGEPPFGGVETAGPGDVLRVVSFAKGETDEGLDVAQPVVVEGVLTVIQHPARGQFPAVIELQVREARRVR